MNGEQGTRAVEAPRLNGFSGLPLIYAIRHGQTDWNAEQRLQGQADTDINAVGRVQADRNGEKLAALIGSGDDFDFVCSPLRRTCETMMRIRRKMGLDARGFRQDKRLMELHFGEWQGRTYAELETRDPGSTNARSRDKWHFTPPGAEAESYQILAQRIGLWLQDTQRPTVCVTHGGVIRSILYLTKQLSAAAAAEIGIPQDRILRLRAGTVDWL